MYRNQPPIIQPPPSLNVFFVRQLVECVMLWVNTQKNPDEKESSLIRLERRLLIEHEMKAIEDILHRDISRRVLGPTDTKTFHQE